MSWPLTFSPHQPHRAWHGLWFSLPIVQRQPHRAWPLAFPPSSNILNVPLQKPGFSPSRAECILRTAPSCSTTPCANMLISSPRPTEEPAPPCMQLLPPCPGQRAAEKVACCPTTSRSVDCAMQQAERLGALAAAGLVAPLQPLTLCWLAAHALHQANP